VKEVARLRGVPVEELMPVEQPARRPEKGGAVAETEAGKGQAT